MPKTECAFESCHLQVAVIIGDCKYCKKRWCGKHRLPEAHDCEGMSTCRQVHFDKNKDKLLKEKCTGTTLPDVV